MADTARQDRLRAPEATAAGKKSCASGPDLNAWTSVEEVIFRRRSIRAFKKKPLPDFVGGQHQPILFLFVPGHVETAADLPDTLRAGFQIPLQQIQGA